MSQIQSTPPKPFDTPLYVTSLVLSWLTFFLIFAGGLVTSTESSLSVPDWPLSYGMFFPPMHGGIKFEHSHRVIAGFAAVITVILAVLVWKRDRRGWMKQLALLGVAAVLIQAVLGGLTVLYLLPLPLSVGHACLGQFFFCLAVAIAYMQSPGGAYPQPQAAPGSAALARLAWITFAAFSFQLVVGAYVRHTSGGGVWIHVGGAAVAAVLSAVLATLVYVKFASFRFLRTAAVYLGSLVTIQLLLGVGTFYYTIYLEKQPPMTRPAEVHFATAHQAMGALLLACSLLIALYARRNLSDRE